MRLLGVAVGVRQSWRQHAERAAVERRFATLTTRERDVLRLVVTGMLNKQIAGELGIAEKTVKIHRSHMTHKMGAGSSPSSSRWPKSSSRRARGHKRGRALTRTKAL
jgi:FixJ family two-component response regulator